MKEQKKGELVGVIDTGIEYQHEAFLNEDGTTRILSIWGQTLEGVGLHPIGSPYGTEFTREQINEALRQQDPLAMVPSTDENGTEP